ncbi:hypothetical protein ES705_34412 [subsurface metagenome]
MTGIRIVPAWVVAIHKRAPGRWEKPTGAVDGLQEELCLDQGVVSAESGNLGVHEAAVGGDLGADLVGGDLEDALDAVAGLLLFEERDRLGQERVRCPGCAVEDGCHVS